MANLIQTKLKLLPKEPGVYFFKNSAGKIIYIGKAAVLRHRVGSYFQRSKHHDPKTLQLIQEIADLDYLTTAGEVEALFLESEFIKRYRPKFNLDLKDDKSFIYIRLPMANQFPALSYTRRPLDDGATYFGPYTQSFAVKKALRYLRRIFPYITHESLPARACLQAHLGLCPNPEEGAISSAEYKQSLRKLSLYLSGQGQKLITSLEKEMNHAARVKQYEQAARLRDQLGGLQALSKQMIFSDRESFDLAKDQALVELADLLGLPKPPRRIECFDISHLQGTNNTASMVVFTDGVADKDQYRKFRLSIPGNDDFAHMNEVITRRFAAATPGLVWTKPDLIVIDGGKGQLSAAHQAMVAQQTKIPMIGLAKRIEEIFTSPNNADSILLPFDSPVLKLLQRIRDEAHRFAVTYHTILRSRQATASVLDEIPGVGAATRKKLLRKFGSVSGIAKAAEADVAQVVGPAKAKLIKSTLRQA